MRPKKARPERRSGEPGLEHQGFMQPAANQRSAPAYQSDVQPKRFRWLSKDSLNSSSSLSNERFLLISLWNDPFPYDCPHEEAASRDSRQTSCSELTSCLILLVCVWACEWVHVCAQSQTKYSTDARSATDGHRRCVSCDHLLLLPTGSVKIVTDSPQRSDSWSASSTIKTKIDQQSRTENLRLDLHLASK